MKNCTKKILMFALIFMMGTGVCATNAKAATANWHLRYVKGAPTTVNIYKWTTEVTTTTKNISMKVSNMNGNAEVYVYTSNGISATFETNGAKHIVARKANQKIYASATLYKYGKGNINPFGTLTY